MKTHLLLTASFLFFALTTFCQANYPQESKESSHIKNGISQKRYKPVFFNFKKRVLYYDGKQRMSGAMFLEMCRNINDSAVQYQIARYDALTKKKAVILGAMGVNAIAGLAAAGGTANAGDFSPALAGIAVAAVLSVPVLAICSSIPHQKRKEVLFQDLPIAYNQFVEAQANLTQK